MKATKGKANPAMLDQLLKKLIDEGDRLPVPTMCSTDRMKA